MKRTLREIRKELKKKEGEKPNKDILQEYMERFKAIRREFGDISEYDVLVECGAIEPVTIPNEVYYNAGNLFPYMKEARKRVKEAMKLSENQEIIRIAKNEAKKKLIY